MEVVIFSINTDASTSDVMDWIHHLGIETIRINGIMVERFTLHLRNENYYVVFNNKVLPKKDIRSTWIRKKQGGRAIQLPIGENKGLKYEVNAHIKNEFDKTNYGFTSYFKDTKMLGTLNGDSNKLYGIQTAAECGLNIPETIVTNTNICLSLS